MVAVRRNGNDREYGIETSVMPIQATISCRMGQNGRIVVPAEIRKAMNLQEGDAIAFRYDENGLHIQAGNKHSPFAVILQPFAFLLNPPLKLLSKCFAFLPGRDGLQHHHFDNTGFFGQRIAPPKTPRIQRDGNNR